MKVVAFSGSARRDGNTAILVRHVFAELEKEGIETELVQLAGERIRGCIACYRC
jgi:multimeric flavodoxin WrbA